MFYNTEELVSSVKLRSLVPSSQATFTDANLITLLNEEMQLALVPDMLTVREDFFLRPSSVSLIGSVANYAIPERTIGNSIKDVYFVSSGGDYKALNRASVEDYRLSGGTSGEPGAYIIQGDEIVVFPTPSSSTGSLEIWTLQRPNQLVATSSCAKITAVSSVGGTTSLTVDTDLSATLAIGQKIDLLSATSPFLLWAQDVTITGISSSVIEVASTAIDNGAGTVLPVANDYVCPAKRANIPMIPQEGHPLLCQLVSERLMEALGDLQKLQAAKVKTQEMRAQFFNMIANRVEADPHHVVKRGGILNNLGYQSHTILS